MQFHKKSIQFQMGPTVNVYFQLSITVIVNHNNNLN